MQTEELGDWANVPVNVPELTAIRRRREIVIFRPRFPGKKDNSECKEVRGVVSSLSDGSRRRMIRAIDNDWADYRA